MLRFVVASLLLLASAGGASAQVRASQMVEIFRGACLTDEDGGAYVLQLGMQRDARRWDLDRAEIWSGGGYRVMFEEDACSVGPVSASSAEAFPSVEELEQALAPHIRGWERSTDEFGTAVWRGGEYGDDIVGGQLEVSITSNRGLSARFIEDAW